MKMRYLVVIFFLTACSTYSTNFDSPRARGVYNRSLSEVADMIDSGEIEKLDIDHKKQRKFKLGR